MIRKYRFGTPIRTDAVTRELPCEAGRPPVGQVSADETGFHFVYSMGEEEIVYGLGEALRGINKRGGRYVSYNQDHSFHMEDVLSLYAAHNFLLLTGAKGQRETEGQPKPEGQWETEGQPEPEGQWETEGQPGPEGQQEMEDQPELNSQPVGLFFDYPGMLEFDIGFTTPELLTVSCPEPDLDLYVVTGDSLRSVVREFRQAIGRSYIPPKWAMGFGQSRWGYTSPADFREVADRYRRLHIPLDAIYMDIDYMERFKDFTVNPEQFPDFAAFVAEMRDRDIHLVPIIDAAVKAEDGYEVCEEGLKNHYFCTGEDGEPFQAAVWPGASYLPDVLNPDARRWFGENYRILIDQGIDGFWNDMNEPSIFYSRESIREFLKAMDAFGKEARDFLDGSAEALPWFDTLGKAGQVSGPDNYRRFYHNMDGVRILHDKVHNLYGFNMTRAAGEAFERICPDKRLLLFSRSSYIGMHRYGGIWTGDNGSWWPHLLLNIQMMPSLNMCGFLYAGADIGGFAGDVTRDLLLRWLAFGVFTPLMRNHSASNTRKQECYRFDHPEDFAHVIGVRYRLLPYLYSEYVKAALAGEMYFRPLGFDYPADPLARENGDQLLLGDGLMVTPVYTQNAGGRYVYLPEAMLFVKFLPDGTLYQEKMDAGVHYISVALNEVPLFVIKEHILPLAAPAETVAGLDESRLEIIGWVTKETAYTLYWDDGYTKDYENPSHYTVLRYGG